MEHVQPTPANRSVRINDFRFEIESDCNADPLTGIGVWVFFRGEPCCDDNGHQYRFFLPLGVVESTVTDVCRAFTLATHCESYRFAA